MSEGQHNKQLVDLRHYVILIDTCELDFSVFEAELKFDGKSSYLVTRLDTGDMSKNHERLELWVTEINTWAVGTWRPSMMKAFSPRYLTYDDTETDSEVRDDVEDEARSAKYVWAAPK